MPPSSNKKRENNKKYYALNKEQIAVRSHAYYIEHKEQHAQRAIEYQKKHRTRLAARVAASHTQTKIALVIAHGGKCAVCGYENCLAALEFHHADPSEKDGAATTSEEANKCVLLCANCHREHHHGGIEY